MDDNGVEFRSQLYATIHDRVTAAIEAKKQEIAGNLIQQEEKEEKEEGAGHEKAEKKMMKSLDKNGDGKHTMADHQKEEVEELDELSVNTLNRVHRAAVSAGNDASRDGDEGKAEKRYNLAGKASNKAEIKNRAAGLKPSGQHTMEEVEYVDEAKEKDDEDEEPSFVPDEERNSYKPKKPNAFKAKGPSSLGTHFGRKSSSGGKTTETKTGRTHSSGDRY